MEYLIYDNAYFDDFFEMALDLWKDFPKNDLRRVLLEIGESEKKQVFFAKDADSLIGFVYISIRQDYVEGADVSPTGYLEGIYVKPDYRKKGIAQELFTLGENWVSQNGCHQIGSYTWDWNKSSIVFHKKIGFKERIP